ncbi:hypothetical protein H8959_016784 [Pygathrix nigripes]
MTGQTSVCRSFVEAPVSIPSSHTRNTSPPAGTGPECLLTDGFYMYKMDLWSAGCVFYEIASLQPLFPGVNELDQISKIHDVIGTPAQKTLTKFKQSRAMNFDFPFKRGSGIPLLTTNLSPQCLSLLHAMVAYDPDERIATHQALQHPYFQEQRKTEKRAVGSHRKACFPEHPVALEPLSNSCWISKEGRKQKQSLKQEEDHPKRQGPAYVMELPTLKLSGVAKLSSYSSPTLQSVLGSGTNGKAPVLRPLKCVPASKKTDPRKDLKPAPQQCRLPTIVRKGGRYLSSTVVSTSRGNTRPDRARPGRSAAETPRRAGDAPASVSRWLGLWVLPCAPPHPRPAQLPRMFWANIFVKPHSRVFFHFR